MYRIVLYLLIIVFQSSCASFAVDSIGGVDGGSARTGDRVKAAAVDLATLPIQAVVLPFAAMMSYNRKEEIKQYKEKQKERQKEIFKIYELLAEDPDIAVNDDFLLKDPDSNEAFALYNLLVEGRSTKFSDKFYSYIYNNTENEKSKSLSYRKKERLIVYRSWLLRNVNIPENIITQAYNEYVVKAKNHKFIDPGSPYNSVLTNPKLPKNLLIEASQYTQKDIRYWANYGLEKYK